MKRYSVKDGFSEKLTKANYAWLKNLDEMNRDFIDGLSKYIIPRFKDMANELLEDTVNQYKGKLIENLLEIHFLESHEEIEKELLDAKYSLRETPETTYLYIIEGKDSHKIKIGISKNIDSRLAHLQTSNPEELEILNQMEFDYRSEALDAESLLHEYFSGYRIMPKGKSTEWFKPDIKEYVDGLCKEHLPLIEKIIEERHQKMVEAVNAVKFEY